jgi:hypothetical protein
VVNVNPVKPANPVNQENPGNPIKTNLARVSRVNPLRVRNNYILLVNIFGTIENLK